MNLPQELQDTKWAVKIESLRDAEELQKLFPKHDCVSNENGYLTRVKGIGKKYRLCYCHNSEGEYFEFDKFSYFKNKGYTIYTITQLKELMKA